MAGPKGEGPPAPKWAPQLIVSTDPRLRDVIALWGENRKTLGLFPAGAFEECANRGNLLVATSPDGKFGGYLAFRLQRRLNAAVIIHLCVTAEARGKGCSDALVEWLKKFGRDESLSGIRLKCRRDYNTQKLWPRLGFTARADVRGRGVEESKLTVWVHPFGQPDLFTNADEDDFRFDAVIDANVFFDLHGIDCDRHEESEVLLEPWVDDAIRLCIVHELHNEINRCEVDGHRDAYRRAAEKYPELPIRHEVAAIYEDMLSRILVGSGDTESARSDRRQIASAAAGDADLFVTRDQKLLDASADILAALGVNVCRPADLAIELDAAERKTAYQPVRLAATAITIGMLRSTEVDEVAEAFQCPSLNEKKSSLLSEIRNLLARIRAPEPAQIRIVRDGEGLPLAMMARQDRGSTSEIPLLRVVRQWMDRTLARHLLLVAILENCSMGRDRLLVTDRHLTIVFGEALTELHFVPTDDGWERLTPSWIGPQDKLLATLAASGRAVSRLEGKSASSIEERLWPAKILDAGIPTFVIAIDPTWAAQLFGGSFAESELFGAFSNLALNRENVYYRSRQPAGLATPARILWYLTKEAGTPGTMAIRACSRLVAIDVDTAKAIYGRYRRIGIYEWKHVLATAGGTPTGKLMALRFADTEHFKHPVELDTLRSLGISSTFQSPTSIDEMQFRKIYKLGQGLTS